MTVNFEVFLLGPKIEGMKRELDVDDSPMYTDKEIDEYQKRVSIQTIKFFEKTTGLLLSGLAEDDYVVTDPRDYSGYWDVLLYWKHPLAKDLGRYLGGYFGEWWLDRSTMREFLKDVK